MGDVVLNEGATTSVSVVFSENMYGFTASDIGVTGNGATSSFSGADGDSSYAMVYTAPASGTGTISFSLVGNEATDLAGNQNLATTDINLTFDAEVPGSPSLALDNDTGIFNTDRTTATILSLIHISEPTRPY